MWNIQFGWTVPLTCISLLVKPLHCVTSVGLSHVSTVFSLATGNKRRKKTFKNPLMYFLKSTRHFLHIPHFVSVVFPSENRIEYNRSFLLIPKLGTYAVAALRTTQKNKQYSTINHIIGWYVTLQEKKKTAQPEPRQELHCASREQAFNGVTQYVSWRDTSDLFC